MISHSQLNPVPVSGLGYSFHGGIPAPIINVRDKGARGDGRTDDTDAFQAAVDAVPLTGGTVVVPRGDYRINVDKSISLHSNMLFLMDPAATLAAIPTKRPESWLIRVWHISDVRIVGGRLVGERRLHVTENAESLPEGKNEQGFGICIQSSHNITLSSVHLSDFWGDGIWIGALGKDELEGGAWDENVLPSTNILLDQVVCSYHRRQGLSMGPAENVTVMNSTFSYTGYGAFPQESTPPMAGIDIEPQTQGYVRNITISHCTFMRNRGTGLEIHGNVLGLLVHDCLCSDNFGHGFLVRELTREKEVIGLTFSNNIVSRNGLVGMMILDETDCVLLAGNTFMGNGFRYPIVENEDPYAEWSPWPWRNVPIPQGLTDIDIDGEPDPQKSREPDLIVENTATNVRLRNNTYTNSNDNDPVDEEWGDPVGKTLTSPLASSHSLLGAPG